MADICDPKTGEVISKLERPFNQTKLSTYNSKGEELPDSRPIALPVGLERPIPLGERIRKLVNDEVLKRELYEKEVEDFEEADDFDVPDDPTDSSPYEENFDPLHTTAREQEIRAGFVAQRKAERIQKAKEIIAEAKADAIALKEKAKLQAKADLAEDKAADIRQERRDRRDR